jgi:hypothetical protein
MIDRRPLMDASGVAAHVLGCGRCQQRIGQASGDAAIIVDADLSATQTAQLVADGGHESRDQEPVAGEVWRVAWGDVTELAVIRNTDAENLRVTVLPVSEIESADEWSLLTAAMIGDVELPVAASVALEVSLPWCVLDARVGGIPVTASEDLSRLGMAFRTGAEPPDDIRIGDPVWSRLDERAGALDDLADQFHGLANVDWAPSAQPAAPDVTEMPGFGELRSAGLPTNRALAVSRGEAPTSEEISAIEASTGRRLASSCVVVPFDLRARLDHPRWRPALRRRAGSHNRSETEERLDVVGQVTQPIAARGTGGAPVDWDFLIERVLRD